MRSFLHSRRHGPAFSTQIDIIGRSSSAAQAAREFISRIYLQHHAATVRPDPDYIISSTDRQSGKLTACAGISFASQRTRLFSERYLDAPLEEAIFQSTQHEVQRQTIAEVGSLASDKAIAAGDLIRLVPIVAWGMGTQAVLCTATGRLRKLFDFHQIPFDILANASADRLSVEEKSQWGSYYDQAPQTGVVLIGRCGHLFNQFCGRFVFSEFENLAHPKSGISQVAA
ncbi:thermostable hemolysin [Paraburkholderia humisilvae]|uniref:Thermostable hemolysin n=1 Tax=Paraburkholderia humisilvae TaxID=627669 RepID=A0A6J5CX96_9BURK|nr:thermostable hemolysin [Paraburkholderia humisilvae]CAB3746810.1 hypothetical protein LMG29542_00302 [Paraburkholderia humisilvae]